MSKHVTLEDYNGINEKYKYAREDGETWSPVDNFNVLMMEDNFPVQVKKYIILENDEVTSLTVNGVNCPVQSDSKGDYVEFTLDSDNDTYTVVDNLNTTQTFQIIRVPGQRVVELDQDACLYRGHTNDVTGLFDFDYTVTYLNKPVESVYLGKGSNDTVNLDIHVLPNRSMDYIATDKRLSVPVMNKVLTSAADFEYFDYGIIGELEDIKVTISQDSEYINNEDTLLTGSDITNESNLILDGVTVTDSFITNNNRLVLNDCTLSFSDLNKEFVLVNNGELILNNCIITDNVTILNTGSIIFNDCTITPIILNDLPFIHSTNNNFILADCTVTFEGTYETEIGYGQCLYRANNYDPTKLLADNNLHYDIRYKYGADTYITSGEGVCYCEIDKDELKFINLTVHEEE